MANTTPAAAIVSVLTGSDAEDVVGIGANLPLSRVGNKVEVVRRAIAVNQPDHGNTVSMYWPKWAGFDRGHGGGDAWRGLLWATGRAGWFSFILCAGGLPEHRRLNPI